MKRLLRAPLRPVFAAAALLAAAWPVAAQNDNSFFTAPVTRVTPKGLRMESDKNEPAHVKLPELDVKAGVLGLDITETATGRQLDELRALSQFGHRVEIVVDITPPGGGAPTHIEAIADKTTLQPVARTLVLSGNVDGFYQLKDGVKTSLRGETVNVKYENKNLVVNVEGSANGVRLEVPAEALSQPGALGTVVFTAKRASLDQNGGVARLSGSARAVSTDGPNKFDVAADEFVLTRSSTDGTIDKLVTVGRTSLKMDLPPEPPAASTAPGSTTPVVVEDKKIDIGRPSHIEAEADSMTITRPDNLLVFEGNVEGFYQLSAEGAQAETRYNFSGDRAEVLYAEEAAGDLAAGLNVKVTGKPGRIDLPGFKLGF